MIVTSSLFRRRFKYVYVVETREQVEKNKKKIIREFCQKRYRCINVCVVLIVEYIQCLLAETQSLPRPTTLVRFIVMLYT